MDVDTFQKNAALRQAKVKTSLQAQIAKSLVPVARQLEMAQKFSLGDMRAKSRPAIALNFQNNLQMIYNAFLQAAGLVAITPQVGEMFESATERVQGVVYEPEQQSNLVTAVVWPGYALGEEIIEPALVILTTDDPQHPHLLQKPPDFEREGTYGWRAWLHRRFIHKLPKNREI